MKITIGDPRQEHTDNFKNQGRYDFQGHARESFMTFINS